MKKELLEKLISNGIFAVVRVNDTEKLSKVVEALGNGGVKNIEITMTVPNAVEMISKISASFNDDYIIGAGTVVNTSQAADVISAGAKFLVSPLFNPEIVKLCNTMNIPVMPGCYTPTEIFTGWSSGADIIKVFPATSLGPGYFKDILAPFPFLKLMPTGGVSIENVGQWVSAGACAVALGSCLIDKKAIAENRYEEITEKAKRLVNNFNEAKMKI